jgi:hypothetical protein
LLLLRDEVGERTGDDRHPLAGHIAFRKFDDAEINGKHHRQNESKFDSTDTALIASRSIYKFVPSRASSAHHE